MRFTVASFVFTLVVSLAIAGPVTKITEKKSLVENTKLQKEVPQIEDIGDQKERSKKSTTTFCVEIRPGTNEAVQKPCSCKDKEASDSHACSHSAPKPNTHSASQVAPASPPPSVNIIHAPPQQPQTLNIIQPAPTLHALHFAQPQPGSPSVQNVHIIQPVAQLPEPVPQIHMFPSASKPSIEEHPSEPCKAEIVKPEQPAPQLVPSAQQGNTEQSHKSEVHVSVLTEDNKKEQESKPLPEKIVEPPKSFVEPIKVIQVSPIRQPCEEHYVVVPPSPYMPMQPMAPGALIQSPFYQLPSPVYHQGGSVLTQCSCKQTHPSSHNVHSMIVPSDMKQQARTSKIMPMTIIPYPVQSEKSAVTVHCSPDESSISAPTHSYDSPMIVNMQTVRSKDGMQGEEADMVRSNLQGERTHYHTHASHSPKIVYDMGPSLQTSLHTQPFVRPTYGNPHLYVDYGRNAEPMVTDLKQDELRDANVISSTSSLSELARITRSEKDTTAKVEEKATEEKKTEEKTSSTKDA